MRRGLPSRRLPLRFQFALGRWSARRISRKHDPEGIRKQVYDLTLEDFEASPVWEFCLDEEGEPGQDGETVRPRPELAQVDPERGLFVVAASFRASDDQAYSGFVNAVQQATPNSNSPLWGRRSSRRASTFSSGCQP